MCVHQRLSAGGYRPALLLVAGFLLSACSGTGTRPQPHIEQGDLAMLEVQDLEVSKDGRQVIMTVPDLLFTSGKAELSYGSERRLDKLMTTLRNMPGQTLVLEGHTDSLGTDKSNMALAMRRADAVRAYLVDHGVDSDRVQIVARGEVMPVADNDTAEGRQQNRRVEIGISNTP